MEDCPHADIVAQSTQDRTFRGWDAPIPGDAASDLKGATDRHVAERTRREASLRTFGPLNYTSPMDPSCQTLIYEQRWGGYIFHARKYSADPFAPEQ